MIYVSAHASYAWCSRWISSVWRGIVSQKLQSGRPIKDYPEPNTSPRQTLINPPKLFQYTAFARFWACNSTGSSIFSGRLLFVNLHFLGERVETGGKSGNANKKRSEQILLTPGFGR